MKKILSLAALSAALIVPARAQVTSPTVFILTNMPPTLASNVVNYLTNASLSTQVIPLTKNCCLSVAGRTVSSPGGGSEIISGSFTIDGTNFGVAPFTIMAPNTTTAPASNGGVNPTVSVYTNWSQFQLSGFAAVTFNQATNTGPGITTNLSWVVNRAVLNTQTY